MSSNQIDPNEHPVRANRGIVTIVVVLGILIVLGLGGLVYGIALKAGKLGESETPPQTVEEAADTTQSGSTQPVVPPMLMQTGTIVRGMTAEDGRLYLHVVLPDGAERVRAYDAEGNLLHEIDPAAGQ